MGAIMSGCDNEWVLDNRARVRSVVIVDETTSEENVGGEAEAVSSYFVSQGVGQGQAGSSD